MKYHIKAGAWDEDGDSDQRWTVWLALQESLLATVMGQLCQAHTRRAFPDWNRHRWLSNADNHPLDMLQVGWQEPISVHILVRGDHEMRMATRVTCKIKRGAMSYSWSHGFARSNKRDAGISWSPACTESWRGRDTHSKSWQLGYCWSMEMSDFVVIEFPPLANEGYFPPLANEGYWDEHGNQGKHQAEVRIILRRWYKASSQALMLGYQASERAGQIIAALKIKSR
jgi:hypothetical protein